MEKKVLKDSYIIFVALDHDVENILVLYARDNKLFKYKADWLKEVWTCFSRKFVEPRIVNVNKDATYSYFDGKNVNDIAIKIVEKEDGHKKMEGRIFQQRKNPNQETLSERG